MFKSSAEPLIELLPLGQVVGDLEERAVLSGQGVGVTPGGA